MEVVFWLLTNLIWFGFILYELIKLKKELEDLYSSRIRRLEMKVFDYEYK